MYILVRKKKDNGNEFRKTFKFFEDLRDAIKRLRFKTFEENIVWVELKENCDIEFERLERLVKKTFLDNFWSKKENENKIYLNLKNFGDRKCKTPGRPRRTIDARVKEYMERYNIVFNEKDNAYYFKYKNVKIVIALLEDGSIQSVLSTEGATLRDARDAVLRTQHFIILLRKQLKEKNTL